MNDLNQLLDDAAGAGGGPRLDPRDLLASGRRRVRNRRLAVAGGVTAVVVLAAALTAWLPSDDEPDVVDRPDSHGSTYEDVPLPLEEVERRCSVVLNAVNPGDDVDYVAGRADDGTAVSATEAEHFVETREGWTAYLMPVGERWPRGEPHYERATEPQPPLQGTGGSGDPAGGDAALVGETACVIPQEDLLAGIPDSLDAPRPRDDAGIIETCAAQTGYDLRGWEPLAVESLEQVDIALLMSDNGYVARCDVYDDGWLSTLEISPESYLDADGDPQPSHVDTRRRLWAVPTSGSGHNEIAHVIPGLPNGYTVVVEVDGRELARTTTHRGAYILEFDMPERGNVDTLLLSPDGEVLARRPLG